MSCGYTRTQKAPIGLFSSNNLPAIIFVGVIWMIVLAEPFALFFRETVS